MNRTYTYAELKERIQKDYETFNFIIESKHIFNQEFIGFRKFFKNLLKKQSKKKNEWFRKINLNLKLIKNLIFYILILKK